MAQATETAPKPTTDDFREIDLADDQQIVNFDSLDDKTLVYVLNGVKHPTYVLVKSLSLEAAERGHAFVFKGPVKCWIDTRNSDDTDDWYWRAELYKIDSKTGREEVGEAPTAYNEFVHVKDGNGRWRCDADGEYIYIRKYDPFARTKAISKADRNADLKLLPKDRVMAVINKEPANKHRRLGDTQLEKGQTITEDDVQTLAKLGVPHEKIPQSHWAARQLIDSLKARAEPANTQGTQSPQDTKSTQNTQNPQPRQNGGGPPITQKQANALRSLGHKGEMPGTIGEASDLIGRLIAEKNAANSQGGSK